MVHQHQQPRSKRGSRNRDRHSYSGTNSAQWRPFPPDAHGNWPIGDRGWPEQDYPDNTHSSWSSRRSSGAGESDYYEPEYDDRGPDPRPRSYDARGRSSRGDTYDRGWPGYDAYHRRADGDNVRERDEDDFEYGAGGSSTWRDNRDTGSSYADTWQRGPSERSYGGGQRRYWSSPNRGGGQWSSQGGPGDWSPAHGSWGWRDDRSGWQHPQQRRTAPKGYERSDERLKEDICERLMRHGYIDPSDVSVNVQSGKVSLEGTVPARSMKHAIEDLVDDCIGVKDIDNRVRVSPKPDSETRTTGSMRTSTGAAGTSPSSSSSGSAAGTSSGASFGSGARTKDS